MNFIQGAIFGGNMIYALKQRGVRCNNAIGVKDAKSYLKSTSQRSLQRLIYENHLNDACNVFGTLPQSDHR